MSPNGHKRPSPVVMTFEEDNTAFIQVCRRGRNPTMRFLRRHHRLSIGLLHETFSRDDWHLRHCESGRMCADIFTKTFSDIAHWNALLDLVNHLDPAVLDQFFTMHGAGSHLDNVYTTKKSPKEDTEVVAPSTTLSSNACTHITSSNSGQNQLGGIPSQQAPKPKVQKESLSLCDPENSSLSLPDSQNPM